MEWINSAENSLLSIEDLTTRFFNFVALDRASFHLHKGRCVALLGENGAGKSTLIKTLAGIHKKTSGTLTFKGREINNAPDLNRSGHTPIAFIHQDLGLIEWMTVAENIGLTLGYPKRFGIIDWKKAEQKAQSVLDLVGLEVKPNERIFNLSAAEKSLLAIARALDANAEVLVLDEPTATLVASDVEKMFQVLHHLKAQGVGLIYVSHRLDEIHEICDDVVVLRDGQLVGSGEVKDYTLDDLVTLIVGSKKQMDVRTPLNPEQPIQLDVRSLQIGNLPPFSMTLRRGELVALVGLRNAGQEAIGQALFGRIHHHSGDVYVTGKKANLSTPASSIRSGIAMVAADRVKESLCPAMSATENLNLNPTNLSRHELSKLDHHQERETMYQAIEHYDIRPKDPDMPISSMSGGNQQKVILARWFNLNKPILILDNPTAGVDIGARAEIYRIMQQAILNGLSVIVISSDFEEVVNIANRALVFNRGQMVKELTHQDVSVANLLKYASGSKTEGVPHGIV
ncbi:MULTISPECIES: sugar ABC transporter ATP-binding protein [unclassified Vibrio]|uniref:Sugar ABC transporter ATP-binding protein n=1 Tax=Vibrio sp. HB236076 TaxID=3232307 RepID=A0AB39HBU1_9VIBR|nr:sugar ABC transporter ATP-binding protein [Vibrio sp. HB161653]MDP5255427.1 sugar ABC transporter ATP-binding protein [Vibrio sp. HB161653]